MFVSCNDNVLTKVHQTAILKSNKGDESMNTVIQIRVDNDLKEEAVAIYKKIGLDLSTAIRLFLKKTVQVQTLPFDVRVDPEAADRVAAAIKKMNDISKANGNDKLTLEEINKIIDETRKARK